MVDQDFDWVFKQIEAAKRKKMDSILEKWKVINKEVQDSWRMRPWFLERGPECLGKKVLIKIYIISMQ